MFQRVYNWATDKNNSINITASRVDTEDTGFATGLSNCICRDGQSTVTANIPMSGFKLTGLGNGSAATDAVNASQLQSNSAILGGSVAGTNTITFSTSPAFVAYATGQVFRFIAANTNTGATTININSIGAINVRNKTLAGLQACVGGEIVQNQEYEAFYDGTVFQVDGVQVVLPVSGTTAPTAGVYLPATNTIGLSSRGLPVLEAANPASAVNFIILNGGATGNSVGVGATGSDSNISLALVAKGTGFVFFSTGSGARIQFDIADVASSVNNARATGSTTGNPVQFCGVGSDTNVGVKLVPQGTEYAYAPTPPAADNSTKIATTAFVKGSSNIYEATPGDPTGTSSATAVMMGFAGSITPGGSGKIMITITGDVQSTSSTGGAILQIRYGTGTAPANGAAVTGTLAGNVVKLTEVEVSPDAYPFTCIGIVSGLTLSTAYWIDLAIAANSAGTASPKDINIAAFEIK